MQLKSSWRRQWHPTPILLPGKSHGWRSLVGSSPWGSLRVRHYWATSLSLFIFGFQVECGRLNISIYLYSVHKTPLNDSKRIKRKDMLKGWYLRICPYWKESLCRGSQAEVRSLEAALIQYASLVAQVKASACNMGDPGLIPGSGRSPGEGNGNPL